MAKPARARVLVLDDESAVGVDLSEMLTRYEVVAPPIQHEPGLTKKALAHARQLRPHVIILDLRLSDHRANDRTGLILLEKLPDAPCILYSNYLTNDITREAQARHDQVQWSGKAEEPEILVKQVNDATRNSSATRYGLRVAPGAHCSSAEVLRALFPGRTDLPPDLVADLLHQLFPQPKMIELELLTEEQQTSVPASRGHSLVCKVMPEGLAPFVVKFGPRDQIEREADRHRRHVHDRLDDRFYGDMSGHALFWDVGAAAYRFIGSTGGGLPTFSEFYGSHSDVEALLNPLRHFFAAVWGKHYRENSSSPDSLYAQYDRSFRLGKRLKNRPRRESVTAALAAAGAGLTDSLAWLQAHQEASQLPNLRQAITHGDLHGDNLFVDGEHAWAIDFERTGPGHILRDFAELEVDILTRLAPVPPEDPPAALEFYRAAALLTPDGLPEGTPLSGWVGSAEGEKALGVVAGLRRLSRDVLGSWRADEHLWALLFDAAFLVSLAPPARPQWCRALLLSSVLCDLLDEMARQPHS